MTGRLGKDILELLVHTWKRLAMLNTRLEDLSNFVMDVRNSLRVKELIEIMSQITNFPKTQAQLETVEKNQVVLNQAMEVL